MIPKEIIGTDFYSSNYLAMIPGGQLIYAYGYLGWPSLGILECSPTPIWGPFHIRAGGTENTVNGNSGFGEYYMIPKDGLSDYPLCMVPDIEIPNNCVSSNLVNAIIRVVYQASSTFDGPFSKVYASTSAETMVGGRYDS